MLRQVYSARTDTCNYTTTRFNYNASLLTSNHAAGMALLHPPPRPRFFLLLRCSTLLRKAFILLLVCVYAVARQLCADMPGTIQPPKLISLPPACPQIAHRDTINTTSH